MKLVYVLILLFSCTHKSFGMLSALSGVAKKIPLFQTRFFSTKVPKIDTQGILKAAFAVTGSWELAMALI